MCITNMQECNTGKDFLSHVYLVHFETNLKSQEIVLQSHLVNSD